MQHPVDEPPGTAAVRERLTIISQLIQEKRNFETYADKLKAEKQTIIHSGSIEDEAAVSRATNITVKLAMVPEKVALIESKITETKAELKVVTETLIAWAWLRTRALAIAAFEEWEGALAVFLGPESNRFAQCTFGWTERADQVKKVARFLPSGPEYDVMEVAPRILQLMDVLLTYSKDWNLPFNDQAAATKPMPLLLAIGFSLPPGVQLN